MRRTASEVIRSLEARVARLEKKAVFAKGVKKEKPKSGDITPTHSDFDYYKSYFDRFLRKEGLSKDEYVPTHMRTVAEQSKTVPVTRSNPDGGEYIVLMAFYVDLYNPKNNWDGTLNEEGGKYSSSQVMYFKFGVSLSGLLVDGKILSVSDAEKFIREAR